MLEQRSDGLALNRKNSCRFQAIVYDVRQEHQSQTCHGVISGYAEAVTETDIEVFTTDDGLVQEFA